MYTNTSLQLFEGAAIISFVKAKNKHDKSVGYLEKRIQKEKRKLEAATTKFFETLNGLSQEDDRFKAVLEELRINPYSSPFDLLTPYVESNVKLYKPHVRKMDYQAPVMKSEV